MTSAISLTISMLLIATLVAIIARRLSLPYTVGLVIAGIGLAALKLGTGALLTHDLIFDVLLPPLLFEAALSIHWSELKRDMLPVLVLAAIGVTLSAAVVAAGMTAIVGWPLTSAIVFGVLIAATDPIAVIALFKDIGVGGRLRLLIEAESLFNDGVAAALFTLALIFVDASDDHPMTVSLFALTIVQMAGGGVLVGLVVGGLGILVAGRTSDRLVEAAITALAAYGAFLLAERFHASGVLATVAAGLVMGNLGVIGEDAHDSPISTEGRPYVLNIWEFAAFVANSIIFLLIGLRVGSLAFGASGLAAVAVATVLTLIGRAVAVYPLCLPFSRTRWAISMPMQHVLWWGGLRGALALALALSLPETLAAKDEILVAAFGVVAFSVIVQGVTMPALMKRLKLA